SVVPPPAGWMRSGAPTTKTTPPLQAFSPPRKSRNDPISITPPEARMMICGTERLLFTCPPVSERGGGSGAGVAGGVLLQPQHGTDHECDRRERHQPESDALVRRVARDD